MQNAKTETWCAGFSSDRSSSEPMKNRPPGTSTMPAGQVGGTAATSVAARPLADPDADELVIAGGGADVASAIATAADAFRMKRKSVMIAPAASMPNAAAAIASATRDEPGAPATGRW